MAYGAKHPEVKPVVVCRIAVLVVNLKGFRIAQIPFLPCADVALIHL